jgi:hypothetical protein
LAAQENVSASQVAAMPPGLSTRWTSRRAATGWGRCGKSWWAKTTSKVLSGKGRERMSPVWKVTLGRCKGAARERARAMTEGEESMPVIRPEGRWGKKPTVMVPGPQPMSRRDMEGRRWGRRKVAELSTVREVCEEVMRGV